MQNIKLTFGEIGFSNDRKLQFPPENARSKSIKGKPMLEIELCDREQGFDR